MRIAKTMLLACSLKMDGTQPQTIKSDNAALIDNVAARYLKFRLDRTLREDDAMLSCRVVRDALNIAVAFESDFTSKTKHMKRLREAFPVGHVQDKDELVLPELTLSYRRIFANCSESWWPTEGTAARRAAQNRERAKRKKNENHTKSVTLHTTSPMPLAPHAMNSRRWNH